MMNPLKIFFIWEGGLSFHGGLIGVLISLFIFSKKYSLSFLRLLDAVAVAMPIGLCLVRIGNFLNGELYGRATDGTWGFIFPNDPFGLARHPSQLYESFGEGPLLFLILFYISKLTLRPGIVSASFLIGYGLIRSIIEVFRQPDAHIGFLAGESLTLGQLLSLPMIICGLVLLVFRYKNHEKLS